MQRAILADKHGITHWFSASVRPVVGRNGKPDCNYGITGNFCITETFVPPVPWPTCLRCASARQP